MTKEEQYAQDLHKNLQENLLQKPFFLLKWMGINPNANLIISKEGSGYQWGCQVSKGDLQCSISCLHIDRSDTSYKGPEYYTLFKRQGKTIAEGRTFKKQQTLEAVKKFLRAKPLEELYSEFSFIDEEKRKLESLRISILSSHRRESEVPQGQIITDYFATSSLWFMQGKYTCRIYFHGYDPVPRFQFHWDDQLVFEISSTNMNRISVLVFRWVIDHHLPSLLKKEFYEINFGPYATAYEETFKPKDPVPEIRMLPFKQLIGLKINVTAANAKATGELWRNFMPRVKEINHTKGTDLYSVQFFEPSLDFKDFSPISTVFEKWAAVEVKSLEVIPENMEFFTLEEGLYAVFVYKGSSTEASGMLQFIYETWLPASDYFVDNTRGHLGVMGEKYKNNDPSSEEEFWIPIKKKA